MALTDLKSDLSKFRRPIERPIIENQSVEINRKSNLTSLSDLTKRLSSPNPLKETPVKSVVTPTPFDTTEKFKGQTSPNDFDFSPQFTTPKLGSVDFFSNTNADGFTARMRESRFNFSSLSSPTPMTLEGRFLGETDPNIMSLESQFLGETTPNLANNTEKFKGQTTPNEVDNTEKFKGQTTPNEVDDTEKFKGETSPPNFTFTPQFTTERLRKVDFIPNIDAKGFTAKMKQVPSQFVDVNKDQSIFTERTLNSKLGVVNFFSNEDGVGFTKNFNSVTDSQFTGIKSGLGGTTFKSNKPTTKLGVVNFFSNEDGVGFTKNFNDKTKSQFTGINGETFESPKVTFSGDFGLSFSPGNKIKLEGSSLQYYTNGNQKWQPGGKRYEDNYVSIGDLLIRENSPSYLTKVYGQFNLRDDSFNPYPLLFRQPFILRGIQRKNKKEPQKWGLGNLDSIMGVDLIRGGVTTSTERALVDVARIGQFILSPKGIVWSAMQVGMQRTNTYNKVWTPLNLLTAVGGQHLGLKPKRHGKTPFDKIDGGNYENIGTPGYKTNLEVLLGEIKGSAFSGEFRRLRDTKGGPDSVYGIGTTTYSRSTSKLINVDGVENFDTFGKNVVGGENGLYVEVLNYNQIQEFAKNLDEKKIAFNDFRTKYKDKNPPLLPGKKAKLKREIKDYGDDYYTDKNIEKRVGLGNSDATIGTKEFKDDSHTDLIKLTFSTEGVGAIQFRGTVNSISETYSPNWTEIKYSGRAENAYIYDTFGRELNFGFRVYAYSAKEMPFMWKKLSALGKMTMPTYGSAGYYGNITKFTLGTMYTNFPALISSLQYQVLDEFTWEIGLNEGSNDNVLPMGVDVTIGLKLLNTELHKSDASKIYDYYYNSTT